MTTLSQTSIDTTKVTPMTLSNRQPVRKQRGKTVQKQLPPGKPQKTPYVHPVKISEISEKGFRVQVVNRDYYLCRSRYPYFSDATDEEIRDVSFLGDEEGGLLSWDALELDFELWQLDCPDKSYLLGMSIRGVPRPDLFMNHTIPLSDEPA